MLMLLVLLLVVVTFQVLAAAGNMAAVRPGALLAIWALLALCVGLFGQWGVFPWLASAVLCGVLVRRGGRPCGDCCRCWWRAPCLS
jgi:hypothetical protein